MEYWELLQSLALLNYDNGENFTVRDRLDAIQNILKETNYEKVNHFGLFELYAFNGELPKEAVLISTHIDCIYSITKCFVKEQDENCLLGTFDNLITNALTVSLMKAHQFHPNVIIAFTGDEENCSRGAYGVMEYLKRHGCQFKTIVLDVTDMGWDDGALFTVENNFWNDSLGKKVIDIAKSASCVWKFVPSDETDIPAYVPCQTVIATEAECDESWDYDERNIDCFSLCIPTKGDMHANEGILLRKDSIETYRNILRQIANNL